MNRCSIPLFIFFVFSFGVAASSGRDSPKQEALIWDVPKLEVVNKYPEASIISQRKADILSDGNNLNFSIAFSGGGTRSAPATVGQLRALNDFGWLDKASYISSVSGGTWGTLPYVFLPKNYMEIRAKSICESQYERPKYDMKKQAYTGGEKIERPDYVNECMVTEFKLLQSACTADFPGSGCSAFNRNSNDLTKWSEFPEKFVDNLYLGKYRSPNDIKSDNVLKGYDWQERRVCVGAYVAGDSDCDIDLMLFDYSSVAIMGDKSHVLGDWLIATSRLRGDESYADILGRSFLADVGLHGDLKEDLRYFSFGGIYSHSSALNAQENEYLSRKDRPFYIANTSLMSDSHKYKDYVYFQMTPMYVGPLGAGHETIYKGDKASLTHLIEVRAFDAKRPDDSRYIMSPTLSPKYGEIGSIKFEISSGDGSLSSHTPFSLADVMASSGAAPAHFVMNLSNVLMGGSLLVAASNPVFGAGLFGLGFLLHGNFGFPEFRYPYTNNNDYSSKKINIGAAEFGDGGHLENFGIMPLLARQEKNILVFINTSIRFSYREISNEIKIDESLTSLFRLPEYFEAQGEHLKSDTTEHLISLYGGYVGSVAKALPKNTPEEKVFVRFPHNAVLDGNQFGSLIASFREKELKGEPLVHCQNYAISENEFYGVKSYNPNICWIYLSYNREWQSLLVEANNSDNKSCETVSNQDDYDTLDSLICRKNGFSKFPNYWTFFDNIEDARPGVIKKTRSQAQALSLYASWMLYQSKKDINCTFTEGNAPECNE